MLEMTNGREFSHVIKVHTAALTVLSAGRSKRSRLRILAGFRAAVRCTGKQEGLCDSRGFQL